MSLSQSDKKTEPQDVRSSKPLEVIYDISHLGLGHGDSGNKTGIFRVIDALARQLIASQECRLTFCATTHTLQASEYVKEEAVLKDTPFPLSGFQSMLSARYASLCQTLTTASSALRLPLRSARKLAYMLDQRLGYGVRPTSAKALASADVYHSTFYPLPRQVLAAQRLAKFLTVYDITPIVQPQYFDTERGRDFIHFLNRAIPSLGNDGHALCISEATKADLCSHLGLDPARAFVTPLAADPDLFYPCGDVDRMVAMRQRYGIPDGPYILSLSTLAPHKNIQHVIRSFARLVAEQEMNDVSLVLTGAKGWDYEKIFQEVSGSPGLQERIVLTGRVADEDLAPLYSAAFAFVYMSFYEGFGLPPLEAMQCGTPVITSNTSSLPEVVGEAGVMLDPRDQDGLCQSLLRLYQSDQLRRSMAQRSLERAAQFSWQRCVDQTINAYRMVRASL